MPPLLWLGVVYLGSLFALLMQSFYAIDEFTARIIPEFTLATYRQLVSHPANVDIILRTLGMAVAVTLAAAVIAFPVANYMARYAGPRMKAFFYVGVMTPMWTSYLVKVYAWRLVLAKLARLHVHRALTQMFSSGYGGEHWLASFAVFALTDAGHAPVR